MYTWSANDVLCFHVYYSRILAPKFLLFRRYPCFSFYLWHYFFLFWFAWYIRKIISFVTSLKGIFIGFQSCHLILICHRLAYVGILERNKKFQVFVLFCSKKKKNSFCFLIHVIIEIIWAVFSMFCTNFMIC